MLSDLVPIIRLVSDPVRLDYNKGPLGESGVVCLWCAAKPLGPPRPSCASPMCLKAAWARYKTNNDPPGLVVEEWGFGQRKAEQPWFKSVGIGAVPMSTTRANAWAWYDRRLVLAARIDDALWCDRCGNTKPSFESIDEKTCSQPWCTECDAERGGFSDPWPGILSWTDEQVAEVERWMADGTAEVPACLLDWDENT